MFTHSGHVQTQPASRINYTTLLPLPLFLHAPLPLTTCGLPVSVLTSESTIFTSILFIILVVLDNILYEAQQNFFLCFALHVF